MSHTLSRFSHPTVGNRVLMEAFSAVHEEHDRREGGSSNFFATTGITWNYIGVSSIVTMLPPMLIFLSLEKYIVRGLTFGAVKG